jgi:hypothetical protein
VGQCRGECESNSPRPRSLVVVGWLPTLPCSPPDGTN